MLMEALRAASTIQARFAASARVTAASHGELRIGLMMAIEFRRHSQVVQSHCGHLDLGERKRDIMKLNQDVAEKSLVITRPERAETLAAGEFVRSSNVIFLAKTRLLYNVSSLFGPASSRRHGL